MKSNSTLLLILLSLFSMNVFAEHTGESLYQSHCAFCHNEQGLGGIGLPLNRSKIERLPRSYIFKTIRNGREGRVMPAFSQLNDQQINSIIDYIQGWSSIDKEFSFSQKRIIGDAAKGKTLFTQKCSHCHGVNGKTQGKGTGVTLSRDRNFKVIPPSLNNKGFLASASDSFIKYSIVTGRPGSIMPTLQQLNLSNNDLNDIVSYIRSFEQQYNKDLLQDEELQPTMVFDSPYDFDTTVNNLKNTLLGMNFKYFPDRYLELGLTDEKNVNKKQLTVRFCNFKQLYDLINMEPRLGTILPCHITIVENEDKSVQLFVMNMVTITKIFNNEQLNEGAIEMNETLLEIIDEATL